MNKIPKHEIRALNKSMFYEHFHTMYAVRSHRSMALANRTGSECCMFSVGELNYLLVFLVYISAHIRCGSNNIETIFLGKSVSIVGILSWDNLGLPRVVGTKTYFKKFEESPRHCLIFANKSWLSIRNAFQTIFFVVIFLPTHMWTATAKQKQKAVVKRMSNVIEFPMFDRAATAATSALASIIITPTGA